MMTRTGLLFAAVVLAVGFPPSLSGQQAPARFTGGVTLVTIDVAVFDDEGRPVEGLTAEDFDVRLDGRVQPVRVLTFMQAAGDRPAAQAPAPRLPPPGVRAGRQTVSNDGAPASETGEQRVFVLLIDDLSFSAQRGRALFAAAQRFVESLPASDLVGIATSTGGATLNPTADRAAVRDLLRKAVGESQESRALFPGGPEESEFAGADGVVGISQALNIDNGDLESLKVAIANGCFNGERAEVDRQVLDVLIANNYCASQVNRQARTIASHAKQMMRRQVDAYSSVITAVGAATGIKHIVVLTDGVPIAREFDPLLPISRAAAAAGVQMSILMEERDMSLSDEGRRAGAVGVRPGVDIGAAERRREDDRMFLSGAQTVATMTGAQFHRVIGDPDPFFERVKTASAAFYRLGVEPLPNTTPGREFDVRARVRREDVHVFVNRRAIAPSASGVAAARPASVDDRLKAAIGSGQLIGDVPIRLATALRRAPGGGNAAAPFELSVQAEIESSAPGPIVTMFGLARPGTADMRSGRREIDQPAADGRRSVTLVLPVEAGSYELRVAAADAEGAVGAVELPLEVTLAEMGPFVASDLFTAWVDAEGRAHLLAIDAIPAAATKLQAMLELYAPESAPDAIERVLREHDVEVEVTLTPAGQAEPAWRADVIPQRDGGLLRAVAELDAAPLAAGAYQLRARVRSGGVVVGTALAVVNK